MKKPKHGYHRHHIVPKHAGGTDNDDNIEYLTVEQHIEAHKLLYERHGKKADLSSANLLLASLHLKFDEVKQQLFRECCRRGAEAAHKVKQSNGFYKKLGENNRQKLTGRKRPDLSAAQAKKWQERQLIWCNNGKISRRFTVCPTGWIEGRLPYHSKESRQKVGKATAGTYWWTDGKNNRRLKECPAEGWYLGRSKRKK